MPPAPPTRRTAAPLLPVQIDGHREVRRPHPSLLTQHRLPGRRARAGVGAAAPAAIRRVWTPPPPVRRPTRGGAATCRRPATARVRRPPARVPARADAAAPACSPSPRPSPAGDDVSTTRCSAWAEQLGRLLGWAAARLGRPLFFFFLVPLFCFVFLFLKTSETFQIQLQINSGQVLTICKNKNSYFKYFWTFPNLFEIQEILKYT